MASTNIDDLVKLLRDASVDDGVSEPTQPHVYMALCKATADEMERLGRELAEATRKAGLSHVPDGWKLVPIVPTIEMENEGDKADRDFSNNRFRGLGHMVRVHFVYHHMIDAAPEAPHLSHEQQLFRGVDLPNWLDRLADHIERAFGIDSVLCQEATGARNWAKKLRARSASHECPPETRGSWAERCAALYQVIGALANHFGIFETSDDVAEALDVACGRGDVEKLLPWPKDVTFGREPTKVENAQGPSYEWARAVLNALPKLGSMEAAYGVIDAVLAALASAGGKERGN